MTQENTSDHDAANTEATELRLRADTLEKRLVEAQQDLRSRLISAELKVEAVRAGIVDLDGLKLLDPSEARLNDAGELENGALLINRLRQNKPWLFASTSSSSPATPPPAQPPRQKLATEMTNEEYRVARTAIVKQRL